MGIMDSPLLVAIAVLVLAAIAAALLFYRSTPRDPLTAAPGSCEDGRDGLADRQSSLLLNSTARDYIRDARLILRHSNQPSRLALHGALQALELALKGYLRGRGWCIEHLRGHGKPNKNQVGHDLARAQKLATKAGLERLVSLREEDKTLIREVSSYWRNRESAYSRRGPLELPPPHAILDLAERIQQGTLVFCKENKKLHNLERAANGKIKGSRKNPGGCGCPVPDVTMKR